jgi:hypothetical protein
MRSATLLALLLALGGRGDAQSLFEAFPGTKIFQPYRADALAHQLSLSRITDNREWIGVIGGQVPLVEWRGNGIAVQTGIGASVYNRIIKTPGHITVFTIDYRVDVPVDFSFSGLALRLGYGHISNHYADDGIEILQQHSINAVKDYVQAAVSRDIASIGGRVYCGVIFNYHAEPLRDRHWVLQIGSEFGNIALTSSLFAYGAIDLKIKEEVAWGSTQSYQAGVLYQPKPGYDLRLAYTFRTGFEERGQLYDRSVAANLVSLYIDL